jgi:hypothetical protein
MNTEKKVSVEAAASSLELVSFSDMETLEESFAVSTDSQAPAAS